MTPDQIRQVRRALGLSQAELAKVLRMSPDSGRTIRRWESGETPITGPASLALEMLAEKTAQCSRPIP